MRTGHGVPGPAQGTGSLCDRDNPLRPSQDLRYLHADVDNVAVQFDEKTLEPKYTLSYGTSGWSNAFLVAEKLGISAHVLEKAHHYLDAGEQEVRHTLEALERLRADAETEKVHWTKRKEEAAQEHGAEI